MTFSDILGSSYVIRQSIFCPIGENKTNSRPTHVAVTALWSCYRFCWMESERKSDECPVGNLQHSGRILLSHFCHSRRGFASHDSILTNYSAHCVSNSSRTKYVSLDGYSRTKKGVILCKTLSTWLSAFQWVYFSRIRNCLILNNNFAENLQTKKRHNWTDSLTWRSGSIHGYWVTVENLQRVRLFSGDTWA